MSSPAVGSHERALEQQLLQVQHQREIDRIQDQHRQQLTTLTDQHKSKTDELQRTMQEFARRLEESRRPAEDETVRAIREQNAQLTRMMEEQARKSEAQGQFQFMTQLMAQTQQQHAQMLQTLTAQKGIDPTVQTIITTAQHQFEALKSTTERQIEMLRDQMERTTNGSQAVMKQVTEGYASAWGLLRQGVEMVQGLQSQGQMHPAIAIVGDAVQGINKNVEAYFIAKRDSEVGETQWKKAQAQAETEKARTEAVKAQIAAQPRAAEPVGPMETGFANGTNGHAEKAADVVPIRRVETSAARDLRLWGPLLEHVQRLRESVREQKITSQVAAHAVFQARSEMDRRGVPVESGDAFELFNQARFAEFVDILLPDVSLSFRDEVTAEIIRVARALEEEREAEVRPPAEAAAPAEVVQ